MDQNDPHVNPSADHLSVWASDEAKEAAAANDAAIREAVSAQQATNFGGKPPVADSVAATLAILGVEDDAKVAQPEKQETRTVPVVATRDDSQEDSE